VPTARGGRLAAPTGQQRAGSGMTPASSCRSPSLFGVYCAERVPYSISTI
jgi:hypothetical protein